MIKLIIFDVGGVLRDSSEITGFAFRKGFESQGLQLGITTDDICHLRGIGKYNRSGALVCCLLAIMRSDVKVKHILAKQDPEKDMDKIVSKNIVWKDSVLIEKIREAYKDAFYGGGKAELIDGVKGALEKLKKKGYRLAIFTNSRMSSVQRDICPIIKMFPIIVAGDDVKKKKPSGQGILKACKLSGVSPKEAIYVGDSQIDIEAAKDSGCKSAVVLTGMGIRKHLEKACPDYIFKDLKKLAEKISHSPSAVCK